MYFYCSYILTYYYYNIHDVQNELRSIYDEKKMHEKSNVISN